MKRKTALVTGGVAAAILAATAAVPALAASDSKTVTERFHAENSSAVLAFSKTTYVVTDNDVKHGKTIGRDVLSCTDTGDTSHCHVAFAQKGGFLYAEFALADATGVLKGKVTGGTGSYKHAKGALAGQAVSQTDVKITLHYKR
jgi:hypothetical protein